MNVDHCLKLFPKGEYLIIEFIPDKYVEIQPVNFIEYKEKIKSFADAIRNLNEYTSRMHMRQIIIIDCDKCVNIFKLNLVLFGKGVSAMAKVFENTELLEQVRIIHTNSIIKSIYKCFRKIIPTVIDELITIE
jgi:hypothetical protein